MAPALPEPTPAYLSPGRCTQGREVPAQAASPLPPGVSGRVSFYAAVYSTAGQPVRAITLGDVDDLHPLASTFKPLVVQGILREVDAGKYKLTTRFTTTAANRSIESYPPGSHTIRDLAQRTLYDSNNTASDILHLAYGPGRLAREVRRLSPCTSVFLTTKGWWSAQSGLIPEVMPVDPLTLNTLPSAAAYARQPLEERILSAHRIIQASMAVSAPKLEKDLDLYFFSPNYTPELEFYVQNMSTARAYSDLMARTMSGANLKAGTKQVFRELLATGCCRPKQPRLKARYWAAKAGSGWRVLTLTGYVEMPDGQVMAYTYLNDQSDATFTQTIEQQIRPLVGWIEGNLITLRGRP
ncbi:serine hydrolase [Deinococcus hohokamensis]|uniref:Serine hydrolase n=1 Tax=Deinococcus hohokamensis TaxID=309883 RepID=A0ABV9I7U3_9DEIO